jgi:hypothetical protein
MKVSFTWVMMEYDVEQVLVSPGDVEFIFLEKWHQQLHPFEGDSVITSNIKEKTKNMLK